MLPSTSADSLSVTIGVRSLSSYAHRLEHGDTEANIEADVHKAVDLYLQAAALGNATAQFVAGVLHATGLFGVPHDEARAVLLYHQAALGGNVKAQMTMGYNQQLALPLYIALSF